MGIFRKEDIDNERRAPGFLVKAKGSLSHAGTGTKKAESELKTLGIKEGWNILDFGCGSGIYTIAAAKVVGKTGNVHAVDLHPASLEVIEKKAQKLGVGNVDTIYSDIDTGIDDESVDAVLAYDVIRGIKKVRLLLKGGGH